MAAHSGRRGECLEAEIQQKQVDEASSERQSGWFMVRTEASSTKPGNARGATTDCKKTDCLPEGRAVNTGEERRRESRG